jgi:L-amino acid N-acyltransferase YncA
MAAAARPKTVIVKTYASRRRGVGHLLLDTFHRTALDLGFTDVIHALMHEDNVSLNSSLRYGTKIFRRYALMGKRLQAS